MTTAARPAPRQPSTSRQVCVVGAVAGCDVVLTVLVPWGMNHRASGTAQAVLDHAEPDARLIFSCGWHITRDGKDVYTWKLRAFVAVFGRLARLARKVDLEDQVEVCRRVFASDLALFMVDAADHEELVREAPAIVGRLSSSALAHSGAEDAA